MDILLFHILTEGRRNISSFDYENAELDILENGGDPDNLSYYDPAKRDRYLREMGLDPENYKGNMSHGRKKNPGGSKKEKADDGCFLTSACVKARGLPDDCEELTVLRRYRDSYLRNRPGGGEEIRRYYEIAPAVVKRINGREDADRIWDRVYEELVLPCVQLIRQDASEEAFRLYKAYTLALEAEE